MLRKLTAIAFVFVLIAAACSSDDMAEGDHLACGLGNGQQATGEPIVIGNVTTSVPGIDFSTVRS